MGFTDLQDGHGLIFWCSRFVVQVQDHRFGTLLPNADLSVCLKPPSPHIKICKCNKSYNRLTVY